MARFFPLTVLNVRKDTRDAVVVTLAPRMEDRASFDFVQGQYLTFRKVFDGEEVRRSYSICSAPDDDHLRVGIKRANGGVFSTWANEQLAVGQTLETLPPMGSFHVVLDKNAARHYLALAAGSGITPVLSLIKTTLKQEPLSRITLIYANRSTNSIMFREELEDLKNTYLGRFGIAHILKSEAQDIDLFTGRIDAQKCDLLFKHWVNLNTIDFAFICGPEPMMLTIADSLKKHGLRQGQIKYELFASAQQSRVERRAVAGSSGTKPAECEASITIDGATRIFTMPKQGQTLLEAALANGVDAPFACRAGVCATCRAMVLDGKAEMETNHALEDYEVRRGYVLTCQSYPVSDRIVVSYDR